MLTRPRSPTIPGLCLVLSCVLLALPSRLSAAGPSLFLEGAQAIPGQEFTLMLKAGLDRPIRGLQVGIQFPQYAMTFLDATIDGTDIAGRIPEDFEKSSGPGWATIKILYALTQPVENPIPAGSAVRVASLRFKLAEGLSHRQCGHQSDHRRPADPDLCRRQRRTLHPRSHRPGRPARCDLQGPHRRQTVWWLPRPGTGRQRNLAVPARPRRPRNHTQWRPVAQRHVGRRDPR